MNSTSSSTPTSDNSQSTPAAPAVNLHPQAASQALINRLTSAHSPGWQTTEFWLCLLGIVGSIILSALEVLPPSLTVIVDAFSALAYQHLRNCRKDDFEGSVLMALKTTSEVIRHTSTPLPPAVTAAAGKIEDAFSNIPNSAPVAAQPSDSGGNVAEDAGLASGGAAAAPGLPGSSANPNTPLLQHSVFPSAPPPPAIPIPPAVLPILLILFILSILTGCYTDSAGKTHVDGAKLASITNAGLSILGKNAVIIAQSELATLVTEAASKNTSAKNLQQGSATALWQAVGSVNVAADLQQLMQAATVSSAPQVAQAAAKVYSAANPQTTLEKAATVNAIATTVSTAAGAPPASAN